MLCVKEHDSSNPSGYITFSGSFLFQPLTTAIPTTNSFYCYYSDFYSSLNPFQISSGFLPLYSKYKFWTDSADSIVVINSNVAEKHPNFASCYSNKAFNLYPTIGLGRASVLSSVLNLLSFSFFEIPKIPYVSMFYAFAHNYIFIYVTGCLLVCGSDSD